MRARRTGWATARSALGSVSSRVRESRTIESYLSKDSFSSLKAPFQPLRVHEVRKSLRSVNEHDRDALAVPALELGIAGDLDLLQLERNLRPNTLDHPPGALAEMAGIGAVERDSMGYG